MADETLADDTGPNDEAVAEPRCPQCNIAGMDNIVSKGSVERSRHQQPWFFVSYCKKCGHVYGTFTKHAFMRVQGPQIFLKE